MGGIDQIDGEGGKAMLVRGGAVDLLINKKATLDRD